METRGNFHVNVSLSDLTKTVKDRKILVTCPAQKKAVNMCAGVPHLFYLQEREDVVTVTHILRSNKQHTAMMCAMDARNMWNNLAVNKYLHTPASCRISSTWNCDARNLFT